MILNNYHIKLKIWTLKYMVKFELLNKGVNIKIV